MNEERLKLEGLVAEPSGETIIRDSLEGPVSEAEALGIELAKLLLQSGAESLLSRVEM